MKDFQGEELSHQLKTHPQAGSPVVLEMKDP